MTFVILTGGIDLSIGSVVALGGVVAALVTQNTGFGRLGFAAALGSVFLCGVFNGAAIAYFRVPPFVVTLAILTIARGLAFIFSEGRSIGDLPETFGRFGKSSFFGRAVFGLADDCYFRVRLVSVRHTTFGRYVYASAAIAEAAFLHGLAVKAINFGFMFSTV